MSLDRLKSVLAAAEREADDMQIDQIAFMIGSFPVNSRLRTWVTDCPRIQALLPEMDPLPSDTHALLRLADWIDRRDHVGYVADAIRKTIR